MDGYFEDAHSLSDFDIEGCVEEVYGTSRIYNQDDIDFICASMPDAVRYHITWKEAVRLYMERFIYVELRKLRHPYWIKKFKFEVEPVDRLGRGWYDFKCKALVAVCPNGLNVANMNNKYRNNRCQLVVPED